MQITWGWGAMGSWFSVTESSVFLFVLYEPTFGLHFPTSPRAFGYKTALVVGVDEAVALRAVAFFE